ncbi:MAG: hypothetical protein ACTH2X_00935 [Brachybacterium tyrofermentans]
MNSTEHTPAYPDFVTENSRHSWDAFTPEQRQQYLDAAEYVREEYPNEELSVALIGTVLAFGG